MKEKVIKKDDGAICIGTHDESANVITVIDEAKRCGLTMIAFIGQERRLNEITDYALYIPQQTHHVFKKRTSLPAILFVIWLEKLFLERIFPPATPARLCGNSP